MLLWRGLTSCCDIATAHFDGQHAPEEEDGVDRPARAGAGLARRALPCVDGHALTKLVEVGAAACTGIVGGACIAARTASARQSGSSGVRACACIGTAGQYSPDVDGEHTPEEEDGVDWPARAGAGLARRKQHACAHGVWVGAWHAWGYLPSPKSWWVGQTWRMEEEEWLSSGWGNKSCCVVSWANPFLAGAYPLAFRQTPERNRYPAFEQFWQKRR